MAQEIREASLNLYNPIAKDPETLLAEFIDRKKLLARILDIIKHNTSDKPQQHVIVVGPRGMGKTTLLCAIKYRVQKDEAMNQTWLPLQFDEEQNGIGDLADFWLEALRHLEIELKRTTLIVDQLLNEASGQLAQQAQNAFFGLLAQSGMRVLLLVDNINGLFAAIDDGNALNKLRALWMTDSRITVIGATPGHFAEVTAVDQAFHDFFRIFHLDCLTQEELEAFLRYLAERRGDAQVIHAIEHAPQRIAAMRILTGGNPRLVMFGYRVLREEPDGDVQRDLERLLDECTPFFKHRIESLAKEARRTFDAIARRWDPVSVDDIRVELRKPSNYISAQIKRLIAEGFVEAVSGEKKKRYQVSERFYNVYYLMRYSREGRRRLRWLVNFMQVFYMRRDYTYWARRPGDELSRSLAESQRMEKLSFLQTMSLAADDGRYAVFGAMVRDAIACNDRSILDAEMADGDPVERYGFCYFAIEILWLLPSDKRIALGFKPDHEDWWKKLRQTLNKENLIEKAQAHLEKSKHWHMRTAQHANAIGVIFGWFYNQLQEAEVAYRKAIKLNPQYSIAKTNLAGTCLFDLDKTEAGIDLLVEGLSLDPDDRYGRYVLTCFWREVLPAAAEQIAANSNSRASDNLRKAMTETLLDQTAGGKHKAVLNALLAVDEPAQQPFEVLILTLQALDDRSVLHPIAREKRDVVMDIMASITPKKTSQK